ncbi:unnamed protein product [Dicrocoelium dendriticum]|nr:unnamed protein product [Dicrocoelium dendriticum]
MSGRYTNLIRWTNKQGEFILLQAESVAKLWGLRKDRNHRMNYDKLSRALRYYYEKNIIRKVHGHKFVYQFIGLQNLLKYCQTSACDEGLQTANRHVVAPGTEQDLQNKPSIGELSLVKDRESFYETRTHETSVTTWVHNRQQIMQTSPKEVVAVDQLEKHDPSVNKDYSERTVHKTNREASVSDCPSRTVGPSAEGCSLPPYSSYPFEVTNQSPIPNSPFVNSLNCDTVTTEKLIWLSSLFSSLASVVSLNQSFPPMPSSQTISLSQSPNVYPVVSSRRWSVNTEPSHVPPLRTLIDHLDAVQTLTPLSSHSLRNPTRDTISEGLHSTTIARNSKGLRQVVPGEPSQNDFRSNTTNANRTTYTPSDATQVYRSPSPHCQCSCHRSFSLESKQPATYLTSSVGDIYANDNSGPDVNRSPKVTEARIATDVSPTQLHHQRHTINMQRLEEQISKLGRTSLWNARAPHAVGACDFVRFCSTPRGMHSDQDTMASSTTHYSTDSLGVRQMNSPRTGESDDPANLGADVRTSGDDQCVWMPVPLSMLTSWLQLLSTIRPSLCNDGITCPVEGHSNDGLTSGEETDSVRPAVSPTRACDSIPLVVKQEVFDESGR